MLILKNSLVCFLTCLIIACGSEPVKPEKVNTTAKTPPASASKPAMEKSKDHPDWLQQPQLENHIAVIGSAGPQKWGGEQAQYLAAIEDAQLKLEAAFKKHQQAVTKQKTASSATDKQLDEKIKDLLLHQAIVKEEWLDFKSGQLYLWLVLPGYSTAD